MLELDESADPFLLANVEMKIKKEGEGGGARDERARRESTARQVGYMRRPSTLT